jgi:hypothetical protein
MIDVAVIHRSFGADITNNNSYTDLSQVGGVISINCQKSLGKTLGTVDINVSAKKEYSVFFEENDSIDVYASNSLLDRSSLVDFYDNNATSFLMSAQVGADTINMQEGSENINLVGSDKTIILTNINAERTYWIASQNYTIARKGGDDSNSVVHQIVSEVNDKMRIAYGESNPLGGNKWQNIVVENSDIDDTVIYDAGQLEAAFPFKTYAEILQELASGAYTNDVQYTFWIDARNKFHWKKLGNLKDGDITYGTDKIVNLKFKRDVYDTVNAAIVNAGVDLNGIGIWWYALNDANAAEVGLRWDIFADTLFAKQFESLVDDLGTATSVSGSVLSDTTKSWSVNEWQGAYLLNPTRNRSFSIASNTATAITVNGEGLQKGEYYIYKGTNEEFRLEMRTKAINMAKAMLAKTAKLRYRGDVTLVGTPARNLNEVYDIKQSYLGFTSSSPVRMRLSDISHNIGDGAWTTQLTFKEDIGTEGGQ